MITLDASLVIAHLSVRDAHHESASSYLRTQGGEFWMHSINLAEVLVGAIHAGRGQELLDDLLRLGVRVAGHPQDEALRLATLRAGSGLKLPDCCALDTALSTGTGLATFNESLARAARERGVEVEEVSEP